MRPSYVMMLSLSCGEILYTFTAPPLFVESFVSVTTIEGHEVILPCHTLPDPTLTFTWSFNDIPISLPSNDESGPTLLSNGSLLYSSVEDEMEGSYTCQATNNLGSAEGTIQLTVFGEHTHTHAHTHMYARTHARTHTGSTCMYLMVAALVF